MEDSLGRPETNAVIGDMLSFLLDGKGVCTSFYQPLCLVVAFAPHADELAAGSRIDCRILLTTQTASTIVQFVSFSAQVPWCGSEARERLHKTNNSIEATRLRQTLLG